MAESPGGANSNPAAGPPCFDLPEEVLAALPADPFEQLDVARKITSIALASRISALESEASSLRVAISERDDLVGDLRAKVDALDTSLSDLSFRLARAQDEKEALLNENAVLSNTIKKLNREVSRLEIFKKTLVQSLNDEEEGPQGVAWVAPKVSDIASYSSGSLPEDSDVGPYPIKSPHSSQLSETGSTLTELGASSNEIDGPKEGRLFGALVSQGSTPRLTPPGSPPRRHSISVSGIRNTYDGRSSIFTPVTSNHHNTMSSPFDVGNQTGRTRVDGKEFFRQVRTRLSYEQFNAFLSCVKDLNARKQTREETLQKAADIFGENKDLYAIFEGLITRNLH